MKHQVSRQIVLLIFPVSFYSVLNPSLIMCTPPNLNTRECVPFRLLTSKKILRHIMRNVRATNAYLINVVFYNGI